MPTRWFPDIGQRIGQSPGSAEWYAPSMRDSKKQNCQSWRGHCYVRKKGTEAGRESQNCAQVSRGGNQYPQGRPGSRSRASNDIVSYALSERNDNPLVYKTFDKAVKANPDAHPLFHSDRGFQYTSRVFYHKLQQAGMTQSMSRVAHCIDNGPMEGFWGILKRERYYGKRFTRKQELVQMIENYICYYNTRRVQRNLGVLTPMEKHQLSLAA